MSGSIRRRAMLAIVVFVLVWPAAHIGLAARYRLDPWEFFAWSMYALPAARVQVRVEVERDGQTRPLRAMGELRKCVLGFARRTTLLGTLASPDSLVAEIFASDSTIDVVTLVTREVILDPESTMLVGYEERSRSERGETGP
jgi:hypothetical protein